MPDANDMKRPHQIYVPHGREEDWETIVRSARAAGMSVSAFAVACALNAPAGSMPEGEPLVLTPREQEWIRERVELFGRIGAGLCARSPETGMSMIGMAALLERLAAKRDAP